MLIKKIISFILLIVLILIVFVLTLGYLNQRPLSKKDAIDHLRTYFKKAGNPGEDFSGVQVLVYSESYGIDEQFAYGQASHAQNLGLEANQPFHIASIGKLFTATLIQMLADENQINLTDPISNYLSPTVLSSLFVYEGTDYQKEVTIEQLLAHTSGVADYFEDPVLTGETVADLIISEPNRFWTAEDLVEFTRVNQKTVDKPGSTYHYTDTGYALLGLIIEVVEGKDFHQVLHNRIFIPLEMNDSYMALRSEPQKMPIKPLADIWFKKSEVSTYQSISVDWAGGGIISTPKDLLSFQKALHSGKLINETSLAQLFTIENEFQKGIHYGLGTMEIRFEEFFFLLKDLPRVVGHIGVLSTHLFYDASTETYIVMNFGSDTKMVDSFKALIEILNTLKRIQ